MQTSRNLFVICAIALIVSGPNLPAGESEAQAKAREALRKKMSELDAQEKDAPAPAPTPTPPAVVAPVPASPAAAPAPRAVDDEATARAREAMRQKINELNAQQQPTFAPVQQPADDEATARARANVRQKLEELNAQAKRGTSEPRPDFKPIDAPPSPLSGSKEARLADLLRQYKADEITPEQYHKQRVKILAEP